jgi:putative ABC transport system ATP-binding protein
MTRDCILRATALRKEVSSPQGTLTIVDGVDLAIDAGESVAIVGPSGSGKSTLIGLLAGLDLPTSGQVWLNGMELSALDEDGRATARAGRIGFLFQSFELISALTAIENVMLPLELTGAPRAAGRASEELVHVGLSERDRHYPRQLSGGEQQRVALARALVTAPDLLFADEPTGNLDTRTGAQIIDLLFDLNAARGVTLVLVTHDERIAGRCARILRSRPEAVRAAMATGGRCGGGGPRAGPRARCASRSSVSRANGAPASSAC